jgi:hypothetical protein
MIFKKDYEGFKIDFEPFMKERNVMVNATQMANVFGKKVTHFLENESTENFIFACLNSRNSDFLGVKNREDLVSGKQKSGTWMHRILALKFAAWLNPEFELWIFMTIEQMLFGFAQSQVKSIERTVELQKRILELKEKNDKSGDDFEEYLQLEDELKGEKSERANLTRTKFKETWDLFNQPKQEEQK